MTKHMTVSDFKTSFGYFKKIIKYRRFTLFTSGLIDVKWSNF